MTTRVTFKSFVNDINKDLERQEKKSREKAAMYLAKKLKEEVLRKFGRGDLYKGAGAIERLIYKTRVGFKKPAYHAHLVEEGTDERFIKNYQGRKNVRQSSGFMPEQPFFFDLLERESQTAGIIMGEAFVEGYD